MSIEFEELEWHDAEILSVVIDRSNPGENDAVRLSIRWSNGNYSAVVFSECYAFKASMNFGVIASESILSAIVVGDRKDLQELKEQWRNAGVDLEGLKCYQIDTNTTASTLLIDAFNFSLEQN